MFYFNLKSMDHVQGPWFRFYFKCGCHCDFHRLSGIRGHVYYVKQHYMENRHA